MWSVKLLFFSVQNFAVFFILGAFFCLVSNEYKNAVLKSYSLVVVLVNKTHPVRQYKSSMNKYKGIARFAKYELFYAFLVNQLVKGHCFIMYLDLPPRLNARY